MENADDKLVTARCRLMINESWYGHFAMKMTWKHDEMESSPPQMRTMGVCVRSNGNVECRYSHEFIKQLTVPRLASTIKHEIEHLAKMHCERRTSAHRPITYNIAADMSVNGTAKNPRIGFYDANSDSMVLPFDDKKKIVFIPDDWPDDETVEYYYDRIRKEQDEQQKNKNKSKGEGEGGSKGEGEGGSKDEDTDGNGYGNMIDNHDIWGMSDISPDEMRQLIKNMCDEATTAAGNTPGHLVDDIKALANPLVSWRQVLRRYIGRHAGGRRLTYSRRNRRINEFGIKGTSHRAAAKVTVIVDTSGSTASIIPQFFTEIEHIVHRARVSILQWDYSFQDFNARYRRGDWKKIEIKGRGGTDMAAPLKWVAEKGLMGDATIMLTDGECTWPEKYDFPVLFVVANSRDIKPPDWGKTIAIKPEK